MSLRVPQTVTALTAITREPTCARLAQPRTTPAVGAGSSFNRGEAHLSSALARQPGAYAPTAPGAGLDPSSEQNDSDDRRVLIHTYPGSRPVAIGAVALCGWVKRTTIPLQDVPPHLRVMCVVCADLKWPL